SSSRRRGRREPRRCRVPAAARARARVGVASPWPDLSAPAPDATIFRCAGGRPADLRETAMTASSGLIASRADVARIEEVPLAARPLAQSTYDLLRQAATEHGEREALVFVPKGSADEPPFVHSY